MRTPLPGCEVLPPMQPTSKPPVAPPGRPGPPETPPKRESHKKPSQDRFPKFNAFVDYQMQSLTRSEIAVWLVLFRDERNGVARTGQTDIAERSGLSKRAVQKALKKLKDKKLIEVLKTGNLANGPSHYRVGRKLPPS